MLETPKPSIDGPIAGMGMTSELGSRPWQSPPEYATVEEALDYYIPKFSNSEIYDSLLDVIELGIPLTVLADTLQTGGIMEGLHTVDVGILIMPVLIEMLAFIAEDAGIEYDLGMENEVDDDVISEGSIAIAMQKMEKSMPTAVEEAKSDLPQETEAIEDTEEAPEQVGGLMARRN